MSFFDAVFYLFAILATLAATGVIVARNPVHAALFLVLAFCSAAGIWMMLDVNLVKLREGFWRWFPFGAGIAGLMVFEMVWVLGSRQISESSKAVAHAANYSNTKELGRLLYTHYVYPFELAAVILLVAMVAAIALTLRRRAGVKTQQVSEQVKVKKADRLRVVKMPSEPRADGN